MSAPARVVVLPDPDWIDRSAVISGLVSANMPVLDLDAPVDSRVICAGLISADVAPPLVIVAHGAACLVLPAVALSLRTQHRDTAGYVLVNPDAPPSTDVWPESPVFVVSDTEESGRSLRGWDVVHSAAGVPAGVANVVAELLDGWLDG